MLSISCNILAKSKFSFGPIQKLPRLSKCTVMLYCEKLKKKKKCQKQKYCQKSVMSPVKAGLILQILFRYKIKLLIRNWVQSLENAIVDNIQCAPWPEPLFFLFCNTNSNVRRMCIQLSQVFQPKSWWDVFPIPDLNVGSPCIIISAFSLTMSWTSIPWAIDKHWCISIQRLMMLISPLFNLR